MAHNPAGAWALRAALRPPSTAMPQAIKQPRCIFSCLRDKPVAEMAQILFPLFDQVIFAPIHSPRATPMADLLAAAESTGTPARAASSTEAQPSPGPKLPNLHRRTPPVRQAPKRRPPVRPGRKRGPPSSSSPAPSTSSAKPAPSSSLRAAPTPRTGPPNDPSARAPLRASTAGAPTSSRPPLFVLMDRTSAASFSLLVSLFDKIGRLQHRIAQTLGPRLRGPLRRRLTVHGAENLRKHPVAVYASNHTSYMDTPVIFAALPLQFRILAKKELWSIPFIGWYLNRSGQIPIDTVNTHATLSSLGAGVASPARRHAALRLP